MLKRGSLVFTSKLILFEYEKGRHDIFLYDCHPEPGGANRKFPLEDDLLDDQFDPKFLQGRERSQMLEGVRKSNEARLADDKLLAKVLEDVQSMFKEDRVKKIDLKSIPKNWKSVQPCLQKTISVQLYLWTFEIQARAAKEVKLGGETFPKGDLVASFRLAIVHGYRFVRHIEANPKCCDGGAIMLPKGGIDEFSEKFPKIEIQLPKGIKVPPRSIEEFYIPPNKIKPDNSSGSGIIPKPGDTIILSPGTYKLEDGKIIILPGKKE